MTNLTGNQYDEAKSEGYDQALQDVLVLIQTQKIILEKFYSKARKDNDEHFADQTFHSLTTLKNLTKGIQQLTSQIKKDKPDSSNEECLDTKQLLGKKNESELMLRCLNGQSDKEQESFLSEKAKSFGYSLDSPVATAGKPKELPVSNLDKAKALEISNKFWHKEFLNNQLNNDIRQMIIKEAKKLLKEIEMGCGKRTIVDVGEPKYMLECGRNTKYILWFCDDCEQAKKICEDILRC